MVAGTQQYVDTGPATAQFLPEKCGSFLRKPAGLATDRDRNCLIHAFDIRAFQETGSACIFVDMSHTTGR